MDKYDLLLYGITLGAYITSIPSSILVNKILDSDGISESI